MSQGPGMLGASMSRDGGGHVSSPGERGEQAPSHLLRGIVVTLVLGPVVVIGALLVVLAIVSLVVTGLDPRAWFSPNLADWVFGMGYTGDAVNLVRFLVGTALVAVGRAGIRWGFHGPQE